MKCISVLISEIDTDDERYRITRTADIDRLTKSIDRIGMLTPPILEPIESGYRVVSGFERLRAAVRLGWNSIECRVPRQSRSPRECLVTAIADNTITRQLDTVEQACAVAKLAEHYPDLQELTSQLSALGLSVNSQLAEKYLRLQSLPGVLRYGVADGTLALSLALELEGLDYESARALTKLYTCLNPTFSQQKEIFSALRDIAARENVHIADILTSPGFVQIAEDEQSDRKQKIAAIRALIRQQRYPRLYRAEIAFNRSYKRLNLPTGLRLQAPKDFESPEYIFSLQFESIEDLEQKANHLQELCRHPELHSILKREIEDR